MALKSFDQYMAETGRQSDLDELRRTFKYDQAKSDYERTGSFGASGSATAPNSSLNFGSILDQVKGAISSTLNPIVETIKSQSPAITQAYQGAKNVLETRKSSLGDKYQQLLNDIRNAGRTATETQTKTTNTELARRGITSDSTAASQELAASLKPIEEQTISREQQATVAQGEEESALATALANLSIAEQGAQGGILDKVASILSGGASSATGLAGNIYSQLLASEQAGKQTPAQKLYADLQNELLKQQLSSAQSTAPLELQKLQAEIKKIMSGGSGINSSILDNLWG